MTSGQQDVRREEKAAWYSANRDAIREKQRQYYVDNREHILERVRVNARSYRERNRDEIAEKRRLVRDANREKINALKRRWVAANREHVSAYNRSFSNTRRALMYGTAVDDVSWVYKKMKSNLITSCYLCGTLLPRKNCEIDHVVPLSRGGTHTVDNLLPACPTCNRRKGSKLLVELDSSRFPHLTKGE